MKIILLNLFLSFAFFLSLSTVKAQENFLFLSSQQFEHLTQSEQKKYIETLRQLILQFEEQKDFSPSITQLLLKTNTLLSKLTPVAYADDDVGSSRNRSNDPRVENAKVSVMLNTISMRIQSAKDHNSDFQKKDTKALFLDTFDRIKKLSAQNLNSEDTQNLQKNLSNLRDRYQEILSISPDLRNLNSDINHLSPKASSAKPGVDLKAVPKNTTKNSIAKKDEPATADAKCIYAGFIVKDSSCTPLKTLPDEIHLAELDASKFKCKSSKEILCNPLVFGYQADGSPYCTKRSRVASKNCQETSNNSDNMNRIFQSWKNPANKKVFDEFRISLMNLCDSHNAGSDVHSTCKIVVASFNHKVKQEFPTQVAENSKDSKTDKSLRRN